METTVSVGGGGVAVDEPHKLDAISATPPNPKRAQAATKQPPIQAAGSPDLDAGLGAAMGFGRV
jgi:hypothetical protein